MDELSTGPRQAALLVHGLAPADAEWLLAQLKPGQQRQVRELVAELRQLGIPAQPMPVSAMPTAAPSANPNVIVDDSPAARVRAASPAALSEVLRAEPPALTARLLSLEEWPWRDALLVELGPHKRRQVESALISSPACPPQLGAALVATLLPTIEMAAARSIAAVPKVVAPPANILRRIGTIARRIWSRR